MKGIKHIRRDFHSVPSVMPQGFGLGVLRGQKILFSEHGHVAYQIKGDQKSRHGYTEKFYPRIKLVTLELGQRTKYH